MLIFLYFDFISLFILVACFCGAIPLGMFHLEFNTGLKFYIHFSGKATRDFVKGKTQTELVTKFEL